MEKISPHYVNCYPFLFSIFPIFSVGLSDDSYGRRVPDLSAHTVAARGGPPILPPQLVHVILNKETPLNCEPTLLPTPHHVMVNHMYALSIKDLVMALSTTTRYRKKYVTTILYKPVD